MLGGGGKAGGGRRRVGRGSSGQVGGGCGPVSEKEAQYFAAQQVAQPTAGPSGAGVLPGRKSEVAENIARSLAP